MEDNYYSIYAESVFRLAESIVLKHEDTANMINDELYIRLGPQAVNRLDPTTWKYYLNVSGVYHYDDTMMTVISLDTLEVINFTKDNLQFHRTTAKTYAYGGQYYKELVNRYPNQERLILGILHPCDINTAISAKDGTILAYPPQLVEEHEYSLINNLQAWIYSYLSRWDNTQYKLSDNLYSTTMLGILYINMVPSIINLRLKACKTNEVHSYHLRQYLASHGLLDIYLMYLTRSQALWLYRNIAYIERNSGKQEVFEWLTEHIMTSRGLPLAEYRMRHNLENMPGSLKPEVSFTKVPLNTDVNYDMKDTFTLTQVLDKEDFLARDNLKYRDYEQRIAARKMEYSLSNQLKTKLLESSVIDYAGSERYTLADILLNHWVYLSSLDHYRAFISVTSPLTGEALVMTARDAFVFYTYAVCVNMNITLVRLPKVIARRVTRLPRPTIQDAMSVVNPKVVSESFAQEMISLIPTTNPMISVDSFNSHCRDIQRCALLQYGYVSAEQLNNARGQKMGLITRLWADVGIQLGEEGQFYADWFSDRNITISEYTLSHLAQLSVDLLEAATGIISSKAVSLEDIQRAMIRIMSQLSSYSVQYNSSINSTAILDAGESGTRPDDITGYTKYHQKLPMVAEVLTANQKQEQGLDFDIGSATFDEISHITHKPGVEFDIQVKPILVDNGFTYYNRATVSVDISYDLPDLPSNPRKITNVIGIDRYLQLNLEEQMTVPDFW